MTVQVAAGTITLNWDPAPRPWIESVVNTTGIEHGYTKADVRCTAFTQEKYPLTRTDGFWSGRVEFSGMSGYFPVYVDCSNEQGNQYTYETSITLPSPNTEDELYFKIRKEIRRYLAAHPPQKGERGPRGPEGKQGPQGPAGQQGPQGPEGKQGPQGPEGKQGLQGPEGKQGPQGIEGKQGPQGVDGKQGPEGAEGKQGPQGDTGPQGEKGDKGDPGISVVTLRARKEVESWSDVGEGGTSVGGEWPYFNVDVQLPSSHMDKNFLVTAYSQGAHWGRVEVRDAWAHDTRTARVQVALNPEYYDKTQNKFSQFDVRVTTLGGKP